MSLDDQFEQMKYFAQALDIFNSRLKSSVLDLDQKHDALDPIWQDSFRRQYDAEWSAFENIMQQYLNNEAPQYAAFLKEKMKHLEWYLYGSG